MPHDLGSLEHTVNDLEQKLQRAQKEIEACCSEKKPKVGWLADRAKSKTFSDMEMLTTIVVTLYNLTMFVLVICSSVLIANIVSSTVIMVLLCWPPILLGTLGGFIGSGYISRKAIKLFGFNFMRYGGNRHPNHNRTAYEVEAEN